MAKILDIQRSGSVGPVTTQQGRFGQIQRQRVSPTNPQTPAQQNQRGILATVAAQWRGLTQAARNAWDALAAQLPNNITGFMAYVKVNAVRLTCSEAVIAVAPVVPAFGVMTCSGLDCTAGVITLSDLADTVAPDKFMIEATPQTSQGVKSRHNFALISVIAGHTVAADSDISAAYVAKFGAPTVGEAISVRVTQVKNGFKGVPLAFDCINV